MKYEKPSAPSFANEDVSISLIPSDPDAILMSSSPEAESRRAVGYETLHFLPPTSVLDQGQRLTRDAIFDRDVVAKYFNSFQIGLSDFF